MREVEDAHAPQQGGSNAPVVSANVPLIPVEQIVKTPGICGGAARVRGTRLPVWLLANYRRLGGTETALLRDYPSLTLADLTAAWQYSEANAVEIAEAVRMNEASDEGTVE